MSAASFTVVIGLAPVVAGAGLRVRAVGAARSLAPFSVGAEGGAFLPVTLSLLLLQG